MFILKRAENWQYYWILVSMSGEILCQSEIFSSRDSAIAAIRYCRKNAYGADFVDESC